MAVWPPRDAAPASPPGSAPSDRLAFDVTRNGTSIGTHSLQFRRRGGRLSVLIDVQFRVGFGPITLFRYSHSGEELWQDGQFQSIATQTNDNGTVHRLRADRRPDGVLIQAAGRPDVLAAGDALPLTHWAQAAMHTRLFNPETGRLLAETARPSGPGSVRLADGRAIAATGYTLAGEAPIKDWYDAAGTWAALDAVGQDGSSIEYRRLS